MTASTTPTRIAARASVQRLRIFRGGGFTSYSYCLLKAHARGELKGSWSEGAKELCHSRTWLSTAAVEIGAGTNVSNVRNVEYAEDLPLPAAGGGAVYRDSYAWHAGRQSILPAACPNTE